MAQEDKAKIKDEEEEKERGHWSNPCDFFVSCLGYAVGLGNVWRFPFLCYEHGGGSFLVCYFIMLFTAGLPIFFIEVILGQYAGEGPIKTFEHLVPLLSGLGYAMVNVGILFAFFYIVVVSWALWYLIASLTFPLSWSTCDHPYNTPDCFSATQTMEEQHGNVSSAEEYWTRNVLAAHLGDWDNFGHPRCHAVISLFFSWLIVSVCLIKGVRSSGRVVYFTSFFPYVVLLVLAGRSFSLPGAADGVLAYLTPQWERLAQVKIWVDAATQVIFSLGPACGCVITLSSYSRFNRNCHLDTVLIALCNCFTSVLCGMVVFAILGFMAHDTGKDINDVVASGPGLAFVVYPEVVTRMSASNLFSFLFFAMLISLALGSIFGAFETVLSAVSDQFPYLRRHKSKMVLSVSLAMFLLGLTFTCEGGIHMFTLFNSAAPSWNLLLFTLLEVVSVGWIYTTEALFSNLEEMGIKMGPWVKGYWRLCWRVLTPLVLSVLLLLSAVNLGSIEYHGYVYPPVIQGLGVCITACTVLWIPAMALVRLCRGCDDQPGEVKSLLRPTSSWGRQYGSCEPNQESN